MGLIRITSIIPIDMDGRRAAPHVIALSLVVALALAMAYDRSVLLKREDSYLYRNSAAPALLFLIDRIMPTLL